ncbi:hypothetical protein I5F89_12050, partial [Pseudomonas aeruginosa]|nr:hypothetical protein [Pseudomonas aeruginosa]
AQADGLHPAVLQLIDMTVRAAPPAGQWVGVGGGRAGGPPAGGGGGGGLWAAPNPGGRGRTPPVTISPAPPRARSR